MFALQSFFFFSSTKPSHQIRMTWTHDGPSTLATWQLPRLQWWWKIHIQEKLPFILSTLIVRHPPW